MNIRHAEASDIEEIQEIAMESWQDTYLGIIPEKTITEIIDSWYDRDDLEQQVKDPVFFVAEVENEIAGFVHASVKEKKAHLHRLYLRPEQQRKGIGTGLYKRAEDEVKNLGAEVIRLEVMSENEIGLSFYLSKGFEEEKEEAVDLNEKQVMQKVLVKKLR